MILRINGKGQSRTEYKTTPRSYYHSFLASLTVQMTLISLFPQNSAKCPTHSRCSVSDVGNAEEGLPWWLSGKESACQCGRSGFNPCIGKSPWRRKWQPTPVFLPGKSHGKRSLVSYSPWGCKRIGHSLFLVTKQQQQSMVNMDEQSPLQNADAGRTKLQSNPSAHTLL